VKKIVVSLMLAAVFASAFVVAVNACKTPGYWKNHPDAWPVSTITMGGVTYTKAEAIAILMTPPRGDATYILAHALIPAKLNDAMGYLPGTYADPISRADTFLSAHPLGTGDTLTAGERAFCIELALWLDNLNNKEA